MKDQRTVEVPHAIWIRLRNAARNAARAYFRDSPHLDLQMDALQHALDRADGHAIGCPLPEDCEAEEVAS